MHQISVNVFLLSGRTFSFGNGEVMNSNVINWLNPSGSSGLAGSAWSLMSV
jgi:hypothetical protein